MTAHTLPSGQGHHFREREFKRSFLVSVGVHLVILAAAGSATLFQMTGTTYAPTYTVDLVSLPPAPTSERPATSGAVERKSAPSKPKPAKESPPERVTEELVRPAGGDEAARLERRKRIRELELEARRLYESYTSEDPGTEAETPAGRPADPSQRDSALTGGQASGRQGPSSDLRFRAYYDQIWAQIRASWVLPEGVASADSLLTVVGIRISPTGEIQQYWVEKKSGNLYYDQSAIRAIRKASPLPPLPQELGDGDLEVGVNFRYPE